MLRFIVLWWFASAQIVYSLTITEATLIYVEDGLLLSGDHKSQTVDTVFKAPGRYDKIENAYISRDGKTIAARYKQHGKTPVLLIMNNDGTGRKEYSPDGWPSNVHEKEKDWYYTSAGVFWNRDGALKRFDPNTGTTTTLTQSGNAGIQSTCWMSSDGRKGHTQRHVVFTVSADYSSVEYYDTGIKGCVSGHGNTVTADGGYVCYNDFGHANLFVVPFSNDLLTLIRTGGACPEEAVGTWSIPTEEITGHDMANWNSPRQIVNHDTLVIIKSGLYSAARYRAVVNILDSSIVETVGPPNSGRVCNGYVGPLPTPDQAAPHLSLNKTELVFSVTNQQAPPSQDITLFNSGTGDLGTISETIEPATVSWLTVTFTRNATDTITVANKIDASGAGDGEHQCTVTLAGGGAPNSVSYTVILTTGGTLAPPSGLEAGIAGDGLQTVTLRWKDNASSEDGFSVERKDGDNGTWKEIATTAANETTWTTIERVGTYSYRVRAFAGSLYSSYSPEAAATVVGIPWIRILKPAEGSVLEAGSRSTIQWETNRITNVAIDYSVDDGQTWNPITKLGGVERGAAEWGALPWDVPAAEADRAYIRIRDYEDRFQAAVSGDFSIARDAGTRERYATTGLEGCSIRRNFDGTLSIVVPAESIGLLGLRMYWPDGRTAQTAAIHATGMAQTRIEAQRQGMCIIELVGPRGIVFQKRCALLQ